MSKPKMGGGLDALLGGIPAINNDKPATPSEVAINLIKPNPLQPRKHFDEDKLTELATSITQKGILQPLLLEKEGNGYIIIAGERRYRAAKLAGLSQIPAIIKNFNTEEKLEIALIENIQRDDLKPIEEALAYRELIKLLNLSQQELADRLGKSRSAVANSLRLLKLPTAIQQAADSGTISAGHARTLLSAKEELQEELCQKIISEGLSVRQTEELAAKSHKQVIRDKEQGTEEELVLAADKPILTPPTMNNKLVNTHHLPAKTVNNLEIEQKLADKLGVKVALIGNGSQGKLEFFYSTKADLDKLLAILNR